MLGQEDISKKPFPFLKWAGGKRTLVPEILPLIPMHFNNYYEPFVGGGAVFFALSEYLKNAYLSDNNIELAITYQVIKNNPRPLIDMLREHQENHNKEYYSKMRDGFEPRTDVEYAARLIYLNKTCYNGLFRVNKKGKFNVPMGKYENPTILDTGNLLACHRALKNASIRYDDFSGIKPKRGDFVYFDPPYHPTQEALPSFTGYTKQDFSEKDQLRLQEFIVELTKCGVFVMLSNSNTPFIQKLYPSKKFLSKTVHAPRLVNCKPESRGNVEELIITNYPILEQCNREPVQTLLEISSKS